MGAVQSLVLGPFKKRGYLLAGPCTTSLATSTAVTALALTLVLRRSGAQVLMPSRGLV
jgi:hypothetical protein